MNRPVEILKASIQHLLKQPWTDFQNVAQVYQAAQARHLHPSTCEYLADIWNVLSEERKAQNAD